MGAEPADLLARLGFDPAGAEAEPLTHNRWLTPGVWRIRPSSGSDAVLKYMTADRDRGATPWDAHWTAGDTNPRRWTYWARETLAYRERLVDAYQGSGIHAPACLAALVTDEEGILLVEWAEGRPGEAWSVADYEAAARALGRAQGAYLAGGAWPEVSWLSRGYLRDYSSEKPVDWSLLDRDEVWSHSMARRFPAGLREGVTFLHANRERLYRIHDGLPATLCHLDFWPKNLFRAASGAVTLIDWSFVGIGSVGEDVGNLVPDACFDHFVPASSLPALEEAVFAGHLAGLREAGWSGDERLLQLGMWASAVKYDWLAPFTLAALDQERHYEYGGLGEVDPAMRFAERGQALLFNAERARRALDLAGELGR